MTKRFFEKFPHARQHHARIEQESTEPVQRPIPRAHSRPPAAPGPNRWWWITVVSVLGVAALVSIVFAVKRRMTPTYWTEEQLGPIQINAAKPPGPAPEGMVWVPGGTFWMGSDEFADAKPVHKVYVDGFWMDKSAVTNAEFAKFVEATNYITVVERQPDPESLPDFKVSEFGFQPEYMAYLGSLPGTGLAGLSWSGIYDLAPRLKPFSLVFHMPDHYVDPTKDHFRKWWRAVPGASWKHPEGPHTTWKDRTNHPVVHICYEDAVAYAKWAGKRLPTEAEFEFAARGGLNKKTYAWGDELKPNGKPMANYWQGKFPSLNTKEDGFLGTAPVGTFPANGFGLYDMSGNVWQWCSDWYQSKYKDNQPRNPQGPDESNDPLEPGVPKRVQRGGSFLCCDNYCVRFKVAGRGKGDVESSGNHIGFRCVKAAN